MKLQNNFKNIRHELRKDKGEFAIYIGVHPSQYSRYENQKTQPDLATAIRISEKLNKTVNDLFIWVSE
jgi:putative transcriptional regulator